jgi:hypothetical protein
MIDILIPVLGRPGNAQRVVDSIQDHAIIRFRIVFICTWEDDSQIAACEATGAQVLFLARDPTSGDYARKIQRGFDHTDGEFVFNAADDLDFTPGWDTTALDAMTDRISVVATNDMANRQVRRGEFGTHNLIRRTYIEERGGTFDGTPGVVLHEGYDHCYVDRELCAVAQQRGVYAFAKRSIVRHRHPLWRTAPWDDTYRRAVAHAREDAALYDTRKRDIVVR